MVLIEPVQPGNIGGSARAMKNMGLSDLWVVRKSEPPPYWVKAMAVHAADLVSSMRIVATLEDALAGCGRVIGTTARDTRYRASVKPPRELAPRILAEARANRVALLFGPEDRGLSNGEIRFCHELIRIPAAPEYTSLNLAQAVMICCYELALAAAESGSDWPEQGAARKLATSEQTERMFERLEEALLAIGFLNRENPRHIMLAIRRMLNRGGLEDGEVRILLGIARQIAWYARNRSADGSADGGKG